MNSLCSRLFIFFFLFISCSKEILTHQGGNGPNQVAEWFDYLCSPSLGGRYSGSLGIKASSDYISSVIDVGHDSLSIIDFKCGDIPLRNIIFHIKGTIDSTLVLGAHYDAYGYKTHTVLPGADDNTSGVAVLLCLIGRLKESAVIPKYNIEVCFWDGEEIGRLGSRYYVSQLDDNRKKRMFYCNVDTVGSDKYYQVTLSYDNPYSNIPNHFFSLASSLSIPMEEYNPIGFTTDCEPFLNNSIPFLNIGCDRVPPYLHKTTDVVANISFEQIVKIANSLIENVILYQ